MFPYFSKYIWKPVFQQNIEEWSAGRIAALHKVWKYLVNINGGYTASAGTAITQMDNILYYESQSKFHCT